MVESQPRIIDLLKAGPRDGVAKATISFEFFPPKTEAGEEKLLASMGDFKAQGPLFIDFTWGAGGSTSTKTKDLCVKCAAMGFVVNMHLTCTNMPKGVVKEALDYCIAHGIRNIVALRGDPPAGQAWQASDDGFECALDLVAYVRANYGDVFCIAVAGYPEGHPDRIGESGKCNDMDAEIAYLKAKVQAGADYVITQLFYDTDLFLSFVARCRREGIDVPILPGMLPFTAYGGFQRMTTLCKTFVPHDIREQLEAVKDDEGAVKKLGIDVTVAQCRKILEAGLGHLHFYTLNGSTTFECLKLLNLYQGELVA